MATKKYYYCIVNKENGKPLVETGRLPFFWRKDIAKNTLKYLVGEKSNYVVAGIDCEDMDNLILKSDIIK